MRVDLNRRTIDAYWRTTFSLGEKNRRKEKHSSPLRKTTSCRDFLSFATCCQFSRELAWNILHVRIFYTRAFFSGLSLLSFFFLSSSGALFNPASRKIRRSEIDGSPGRRWRQCCLMMTFKCGAASFDCSRGVARRDATFFFVSLFLVFLSLSIFHFLADTLSFSFYPFRISRSDRK